MPAALYLGDSFILMLLFIWVDVGLHQLKLIARESVFLNNLMLTLALTRALILTLILVSLHYAEEAALSVV